jgi:phosphatidylglycerol---prolipoprotein diacylglyceryl transferase
MSGYFLITLFIWRFIVEFWKEPQGSRPGDFDYDVMQALGINMGQILSLPMILLGIGVLYFAFKEKKTAR